MNTELLNDDAFFLIDQDRLVNDEARACINGRSSFTVRSDLVSVERRTVVDRTRDLCVSGGNVYGHASSISRQVPDRAAP